MSTKIETQETWPGIEVIKWISTTILLLAAIIGNYVCSNIMLIVRLFIIIGLIITASVIALSTRKVKSIIAFTNEARIEARRVIWPSKKETLNATLIVITITTITSILIWGLDCILVKLITFITGLRL